MKNQYETIELRLSSTIEQAVNQLLQVHKEGRYGRVNFNGTLLYSDTVTMDDAHLAILGQTKAEYDADMQDHQQRRVQEEQDHVGKIPELTAFWVAKGQAVLSEDRHQKWAELVPHRVADAYRGNDLANCLEVVKILNTGGTFDQAKIAMESQAHSGMSFSHVCLMVETFAERGKEFTDYVAM